MAGHLLRKRESYILMFRSFVRTRPLQHIPDQANFKMVLFNPTRSFVAHENGTKVSQHASNMAKVSSSSKKTQGKQSHGKPGPEMGMFRSFFTPITSAHPSSHLLHKRHTLRWDWHLRNLIYSLIPACVLALIGSWIKWYYADKFEKMREELKLPVEVKKALEEELSLRKKGTIETDEKLEHLSKALAAMQEEIKNIKASTSEKQVKCSPKEPATPPEKSTVKKSA